MPVLTSRQNLLKGSAVATRQQSGADLGLLCSAFTPVHLGPRSPKDLIASGPLSGWAVTYVQARGARRYHRGSSHDTISKLGGDMVKAQHNPPKLSSRSKIVNALAQAEELGAAGVGLVRSRAEAAGREQAWYNTEQAGLEGSRCQRLPSPTFPGGVMRGLGLGQLGGMELVIIIIAVMLIFGVGRLGNIGSSLGQGIREFRNEVSGKSDEDPEGTRHSQLGGQVE